MSSIGCFHWLFLCISKWVTTAVWKIYHSYCYVYWVGNILGFFDHRGALFCDCYMSMLAPLLSDVCFTRDKPRALVVLMAAHAFLTVPFCFIPLLFAANTSEQFSNVSSPLPLEMTSPLPLPPPAGVDDAHGLLSPRPNNLSATPGAPTPSSANMTLSLDGYLEPTRLSLTTPHFSHQPITSPSEESFPFFSPPPYPALRDRHAPTRASAPAAHDIGPPWLRDHLTYHRPSVSTTSPVMSHHTCKVPNPFPHLHDFFLLCVVTQSSDFGVVVVAFIFQISMEIFKKYMKMYNVLLDTVVAEANFYFKH